MAGTSSGAKKGWATRKGGHILRHPKSGRSVKVIRYSTPSYIKPGKAINRMGRLVPKPARAKGFRVRNAI